MTPIPLSTARIRFIVGFGNAARQNATSGSNDLQLSAEDQILIHGTALIFETDLITNFLAAGQMLLRSDGSMTFDTSGGTGNFAFVGGNVGWGDNGTESIFQVNDTATAAFVVTSAGQVGIGTTSPPESWIFWVSALLAIRF